MELKSIKTKDDVIEYVGNNISNNFAESCIDVLKEIAGAYLIQYPDLLDIKISQKYLRHSELVLSKVITVYLVHFLTNHGYDCKKNGAQYNTLLLKKENTYVHIMSFDEFMSRSKPYTEGKSKSLYIVLANETECIVNKLCDFNISLNQSEYLTIDRFIKNRLGEDIWNNEFEKLFKEISKIINDNKIFDIIKSFSNEEQKRFMCVHNISTFDFQRISNDNSIDFSTYSLINEQFILKKDLLVSNYDFATSYMTSEWLFQNLLRDDTLDKTFIVSGYLKSIEQLLFYYAKTTEKTVYIWNKENKGFTGVQPNSKDFDKSTLGNLKYLLLTTPNCFREELQDSKKVTIDILSEWINKERNGYFHKHNIKNIDTVNEIRNQTFLLYFLIIGSLRDLK